MSQPDKSAFATRVIHAGQSPDPTTGALMPPIYANSTYLQQSPGVHKGLDYGRSHNPTRWALERCVADLEGGTQAFAFASGLAAISTVLELLDAGAHIVSGNDLYGGTFRLFDKVRQRSAGHRFSFVDLSDVAAFEAVEALVQVLAEAALDRRARGAQRAHGEQVGRAVGHAVLLGQVEQPIVGAREHPGQHGLQVLGAAATHCRHQVSRGRGRGGRDVAGIGILVHGPLHAGGGLRAVEDSGQSCHR